MSNRPPDTLRLADIADVVYLSVIRDAGFSTLGILSRDRPGQLCPFFDGLYADDLRRNPQIVAVITTPDLAGRVPDRCGVALAEDPLAAFLDLHTHLASVDGFYWRRFETEIGEGCDIHPSAFVAARNVRVDKGVRIEPNATILERCVIGRGSVVRAGAVIGAEGFQVMARHGRPVVVPHYGSVEIGADVEIQSGTNVARGVFGEATTIGDESKVGGHCQIGHGVNIGRACRIMPGTTICGSSRLGDRVWLAADVTISNSLTIGDNAAVFLGETVTRDIPAGMAQAKGRILPKERLVAVTAKVKQGRRGAQERGSGRI